VPPETGPPPRRISRTDLTGINPGRDMISGSVGSPNVRDARGALLVNSRAPNVYSEPLRLERPLALRGTLARRSSLRSRECDVHVCQPYTRPRRGHDATRHRDDTRDARVCLAPFLPSRRIMCTEIESRDLFALGLDCSTRVSKVFVC